MTKRKRQPTADVMREQLRLAADPDSPYRINIICTSPDRLILKQQEAKMRGMLPMIRRIFGRSL